MRLTIQTKQLAIVVAMMTLGACSSVPVHQDGAPTRLPANFHDIPDAVPKAEPMSRYGNPESYEVNGKRYFVMSSRTGYSEQGVASWYGTKFHGRRTSSGEPYDMFAMTAAHKTLPLPTYARVRNLDNDKEIVVKINDRGPFHDDRIIDLSYTAAAKLGILAAGTGRVEVSAIDLGPQPLAPQQSVSEEPLYVQVGAFSEKDNAERLLERLQSKAILGGIHRAESANPYMQLFRVRVGPFQQRTDAERMARNLIEMGLNEAKILSD